MLYNLIEKTSLSKWGRKYDNVKESIIDKAPHPNNHTKLEKNEG